VEIISPQLRNGVNTFTLSVNFVPGVIEKSTTIATAEP